MGDAIVQEAIAANHAGAWKPGKSTNDCVFETGTIPGYDRKAFRVTAIIRDCSLEAMDLLFSTPNNNRLYEAAIANEITVEDDAEDRSRLVHTKFGVQGVVSARDFVTRQASRMVDASFSTAAAKTIQGGGDDGDEAAVGGGAARMFVFASKSVEGDRRIPAQPNSVRGFVHLHAFIAKLVADGRGGAATTTTSSSVKLVYLSCVDPRGSIPTFALESSWPAEGCAKMARIRDIALLIENLMANVKRVQQQHLIIPSTSPVAPMPPTVALAVEEDVAASRASVVAPTPQSLRSTVAPRAPEEREQPKQQQEPVVLTTQQPEVASPPQQQPVPAAIAPEAKPTIQKLLRVFQSPDWVVSKTLDNCLMEEMQAPFAPDRKVLRISSTFQCTMGTFCEFLADVSQVRKYDPAIDTFDVIRETPAGVVLYTSYKQQTRLVAARDFCTITAKAELNSDEVTEYGLPPCSGAYVQCSVNATDRPPAKNFTRGVVHMFGYVAVAEGTNALGTDMGSVTGSPAAATPGGSGASIRVYNIVCVDPSGSIPKWLVEAANADSCKKLATIRKLCEDRQRVMPGAAPRRLSMRGRPSSTFKPPTAATHQDPAEFSDTSSSNFHSCIDETEVINEQEELRGFYEAEVKEVVEHLILLHRAQSWELEKTVDDIRLETMQTSFCDKKAIKIACEFKCSLETFRTVITGVEYTRRYNTSLNEMETLDSPPYGAVVYTNYKSGSKLVQPRDFCTLTAAKLLSEEEGAEAGLYTRGFHAAAYVISSINATDKPQQPGYVRGTVHAHGYIAVAVPPDAQRIRVFNVSLVDPNGSIPTKLVDAAVGNTIHQVSNIRKICEAVHQAGGAIHKATQQLVLPGAPADSTAFPAVDEVPILRKLARVHASSDWHDPHFVGKVQVSWCPSDVNPDVPTLRFATEFMCSLDAFARFVSTSDHQRKCDPDIDVVKYLDGPPNATVSYVSHSHASKAFSSIDLLQLTVSKTFAGEEGSDLSLYTKGITAEAFVLNSIHWTLNKELASKVQHDSTGRALHRGVVQYLGYVAIATPPSARRVRVFHYVSIADAPTLKGNGGSGAAMTKPKESACVDIANKLTRMAAFCEQVQRDIDAATMAPVAEPSTTTTTTTAECAQSAANSTTPPPPPPAGTAVSQPDQPPQQAAPSSTAGADSCPAKRALAVTATQDDILSRLLELQRRRDWGMGKVVERCLLEQVAVPYCNKKAIRISTDVACSLRTFAAFLGDTSQVRVLDPTLDAFDIVSQTDADTVVIYTSYQQQSRFVAPRDFFSVTTRVLLDADSVTAHAPIACLVPVGHCALVQNSKSIAGHPAPEGSKLVRGTVHVHGFFAVAPSLDAPKIKVYNISCVDPSGSIPNWIIEAVNAESCKKLAVIRRMCEERQK